MEVNFARFRKQAESFCALQPGVTVTNDWSRGSGKALALNTPIPTPSGWTTMADVRIGDVLFDENGAPCRVTNTTEVMHGRTCFEVCFDNGDSIVADAEHQWFTWTKGARASHSRKGPWRNPGVHPAVRTTQQIAESLIVGGRERNHSIPVALPLRCQNALLPIHPYMLGAWLGDGNTDDGVLTVGAQDHDEFIANMARVGERLGKRRLSPSGASAYCVRGLKVRLRSLGTLGNKHIPSAYQRASEQQRRDLLAGLLDTDGSCADGKIEFTSISKALADGVYELATSLGYKASVSEGRASLNGVDCGPKYRVYFATREDVFWLARKNARIVRGRAQVTRTTHRYIVGVRPVDSVPVKCIEVDSPSHLFLAGSAMVPTHNSWFLRQAGWWLQVAKYDGQLKRAGIPGVRIYHLMPTLEQSRRVHGPLLMGEVESDWAMLGGHLNRTTWTVNFPGGSYIQWITAERAQAQRGLRGDILTSDEIDDIPLSVFESITSPFFSEPHSLRMQLLGGTPRMGRKGALYHYARHLPKLLPEKYKSFHATCWEAIAAGIVDESYVRQMQAVTPEEIFKREWECDYDAAEGIIFSTFRENFHVRNPPGDVQWDDMFYVADHGYEDPGVILLIGQLGSGADATYWILDEVYEQHQEPDWWLDKVRERVEWYPQAKWYPDPARPDLCKSWKRAGARVQEVIKYAGSVEDGIDVIKRLLHIRKRPGGEVVEYAKLYVSECCPRTIDEFQLYKRKRDSRDPDVFLEDIVDSQNHSIDSIRYGFLTRLGYTSRKTYESGETRQ